MATDVIQLDDVAKQCGMTVNDLQTGGAAFFAKLDETKRRLVGPLVAASSASDASPDKFLNLIGVLAEAFAKSAATPRVAEETIVDFPKTRVNRAKRTRLRENASALRISSVRESKAHTNAKSLGHTSG